MLCRYGFLPIWEHYYYSHGLKERVGARGLMNWRAISERVFYRLASRLPLDVSADILGHDNLNITAHYAPSFDPGS